MDDKCTTCNGDGRLTCQKCLCNVCKGKKTAPEQCGSCNGTGLRVCKPCEGSDKTVTFKFLGYKQYKPCTFCKGVGSINCDTGVRLNFSENE
jgi:hypothetical protein